MKKAIHQVAADILAEHKQPMTADEIYEVIISRELYEFKAKSPKGVLRSQLRRHCKSESPAQASSAPTFVISPDGHFSLA